MLLPPPAPQTPSPTPAPHKPWGESLTLRAQCSFPSAPGDKVGPVRQASKRIK